jgi:hypothetical protein
VSPRGHFEEAGSFGPISVLGYMLQDRWDGKYVLVDTQSKLRWLVEEAERSLWLRAKKGMEVDARGR